ncbi:MAG TPA: ATP-binding protein [Gammaproteobacteria bacterium]|nr:ATP-binding protein [Gammaproteobacteria bacterium]
MNEIIGRKRERKTLEEVYSSNLAEFIAVYGRRRVGKTYLLRNFFQEKAAAIYFQTTGIYKGTLSQQLARFMHELGETFYQGASLKMPANWMEAFDELTRAISRIPQGQKIILFFDELPWMATKKSGFIATLEYFWNRYWVNDNRIKLIACGSAAAWIIKKIIKNRGGLHNRVTRKINLLPFNLYETSLYLKYLGYSCSIEQITKLYMVTGGVPFYLKNINKKHSIDVNIDNLFFHPTGIFFDEFEEIFYSLFEQAEQYLEIVTLMAAHKDGVPRNFIDKKNKLTGKGGRLTQRLEDLEHAGFISSYVPFEHKKIGIIYRISDEYCYFYLKWIAPIKNKLKQNPAAKYWKSKINTPEYFNWLGYVFENICYKHISQIKYALSIEEESLASPWRYMPRKGSEEQGAQIDLVFDRQDSAITLCEIKYTEQPFAIDKQYAEKLKRKMLVFDKITRTHKQLFMVMIAAAGLKKTMYSEDLISNVVKLDDLFTIRTY